MTANDIINKLIMDAIDGYSISGSMKDGFTLELEQLQLRRISDPGAEEVLALGKERKLEIEFNSTKRRFVGMIDLETAVLNERQIAHLERCKRRKKDSKL